MVRHKIRECVTTSPTFDNIQSEGTGGTWYMLLGSLCNQARRQV